MNISFTGNKNAGYLYTIVGITNKQDPKIKQSEQMDILNIQLTDDYNGKDYTQYRDALSNSTIPHAVNKMSKGFLNITLLQPIDNNNPKAINIAINGEPLPVNDKNLRLISFIAKLLKKVSSQPENEFIHNADYLSEDAHSSYLFGQDFREIINDPKACQDIMDIIHTPVNIKNGTKRMNDILMNKMYDYLA